MSPQLVLICIEVMNINRAVLVIKVNDSNSTYVQARLNFIYLVLIYSLLFFSKAGYQCEVNSPSLCLASNTEKWSLRIVEFSYNVLNVF